MRISDWSSDVCSSDLFTVPADYQSVHDLFRELQVGPYAYLHEQGIAALARRHWPILALLGTLLLLWLLYTFRVEKLVHARTRALRETMEERKHIDTRMRSTQESVDHLSRLSGSEESRVGKECLRKGRYRWSPDHTKKNDYKNHKA